MEKKANTIQMNIKFPRKLKSKAEHKLFLLGISPSSAIQMFYKQLELNNPIPFDLKGEITMAEKDEEKDTVQLNIRIDKDLKSRAEEKLSLLGISPSSAIQMLYAQIDMTNSFPLSLTIPDSYERIDSASKNNANTINIEETDDKKPGTKKIATENSTPKRVGWGESPKPIRVVPKRK